MPGVPRKVRAEVAMTGDPWAPAAGDWVDLTELGRIHLERVQTFQGRQQMLGAMEPGEASVVFVDPERNLDPHNPLGPYFEEVEENRPIRLSAIDAGGGSRPLWRGFLRDPLPEARGFADHAAELRCVDALGVPATWPLPPTALEVFLAADPPAMTWGVQLPTLAPVVRSWWRFEEAAGVMPVDSGPRGLTAFSNDATQEGLGNPQDPFSYSMQFNGVDEYVNLGTNAVPANWPGVQVPFTIGFWLWCAPRAGTGTSRRTIYHQGNNAVDYGLEICVQDSTALNSPGELIVRLRGPARDIAYYPEDLTGAVRMRVDDSTWHWVVVAYGADANNGYLAVNVDNTTVIPVAAKAPVPTIYQGSNYNCLVGATGGGGTTWFSGSIDELVLMSGAADWLDNELSQAARDSLVWRTLWTQYGQYTDDRVRALLDVMGWPAALTDVPARADAQWSDWKMTGVRFAGETIALELLNEAAYAERGSFHATPDGKLKMVGYNGYPTAVSATWAPHGDPTAGALPYESVALERTKVTNEVAVTRSGEWWWFMAAGGPSISRDPASIAKHRRRYARHEVPLVDRLARNGWAWLEMANNLLPASRFRALTVNPMASDAVADALLATRLEDLHRVRHTPPGAGYTLDANARVAGIGHTWTRDQWRSTLHLAPPMYRP